MKGRIGKSLVAGEDSERSQAFRILGYKLWYDPSLEFEHHIPVTRLDWNYIRKLYNSFGRASINHNIYEEILNKKQVISAFVRHYLIQDNLNKIVNLLKA